MKKNILFWAFLLGLAVVIWAGYRQKSNQPASILLQPTVLPSLSPTPSPTPDLNPGTKKASNNKTPKSPARNAPPYDVLTKPATCQIGGQIKFLSPTIAEHLNTYLIFTGIDSPARLFKWHVAPIDRLDVGPNLTASIKLPDGKELINVVLPEKPIAANYKLTASMTYGRLVNGDIKVYEVQCDGQTEVVLPFK